MDTQIQRWTPEDRPLRVAVETLTPTTGLWSLVEMGNVLQRDKQQQVVALGWLGWPLRRIEAATGVRRETISAYLKAAGIAVRGWGRPGECPARPAISPPVASTDFLADAVAPPPGRAPWASACKPYRPLIDDALNRSRNVTAIWQDFVDEYGFTARNDSVKRHVAVLCTQTAPEALVVIVTALARKRRSTTAMVPWSGIRRRGSTAGRGSSSCAMQVATGVLAWHYAIDGYVAVALT